MGALSSLFYDIAFKNADYCQVNLFRAKTYVSTSISLGSFLLL